MLARFVPTASHRLLPAAAPAVRLQSSNALTKMGDLSLDTFGEKKSVQGVGASRRPSAARAALTGDHRAPRAQSTCCPQWTRSSTGRESRACGP